MFKANLQSSFSWQVSFQMVFGESIKFHIVWLFLGFSAVTYTVILALGKVMVMKVKLQSIKPSETWNAFNVLLSQDQE